MKKIFGFILLLASVTMVACKEKNTPDSGGSSSGGSTDVVTPTDTTITTTDTIRITWNGAATSIEGTHADVNVTSENGYVVVNSTVKDITYLLSGNGQGQLTIYGTNRHQLILNDLTLSCNDGPAINNQCKKSCFVVLNGTNSLSDASTYATSDEDRKAALFSEGQLIFSGNGNLSVTGNYKHAIASDDYIQFAESTGTLTLKAANDGIHANDGIYFDGGTFGITAGSDGVQCDSMIVFNNGALTISAEGDGIQSDTASITINGGSVTVTNAGDKGISAFGDVIITNGTIRVTSAYKCIKAGKKDDYDNVISAGNITISGGDIQVICTGTSSSGGGWGGWGGNSSSSSSPEGIEAKGAITISGGVVYSQSSDDAINAGGDFTISGGCVCAYSTGNDGLDANGNFYIKGGLIYAIGARSPEVAIDANSEQQKKLYVTGGTLVTIGGLESGSQLTQSCYSASYSANTWYALVVGEEVFAFKTPSSSNNSSSGGGPGGGGPGGGSSSSTLVVSGATKPALFKSVTASGTAIFNSMAFYPASYTGGSSVTLSDYTSSGGGFGGW